MRTPRRNVLAGLAAVLLVLVSVSGACSSSDDTPTLTSSTLPGSGASSTTVPGHTPDGELDCVAIADARLEFAGDVQLLANLVGPEQYELIREGTVEYDHEAMAAAIATLRVLEEIETPLGDVQEALDVYARANELAGENIASDDPFGPGGQGPELAALVQEDNGAGFVAYQGPINFAIGDAGCN